MYGNHMSNIHLLIDRPELALLARKHQILLLSRMLSLQVHFVSTTLDARVRTVRALVGLLPRVPPLLPPQRVVVGRGIRARVARERLLPRVLPYMHFKRTSRRPLIPTITTQKRLDFLVYDTHMDPQLSLIRETLRTNLTRGLQLLDFFFRFVGHFMVGELFAVFEGFFADRADESAHVAVNELVDVVELG